MHMNWFSPIGELILYFAHLYLYFDIFIWNKLETDKKTQTDSPGLALELIYCKIPQ